jgi:type I restriction enzyme S subunit
MEIGVIPEDWDAKPLGELGEALIGLTYKPQDVRKYGTLVLRSSNIQNDTLAFDDNVFVDTDIPERIKVRPGDVLICVRNGSRDLIGKSALLDARTEGMTFGAFMAVYRSSIGPLVSYLFQSEILKRQINEHLGATINQITNKSLNAFRIPVPPSEAERSAIASALSDVDALLGGLDRLITKKRDLKQAAMQQLLTGQTRLPGFHGEWEVKRLGCEIDDLLAGVSVNSTTGEKSANAAGPFILKTSAVSDGVFLRDEAKPVAPSDRQRLKLSPLADTVLISRMNTIDLVGECGYVDADYPFHFVPDRLWMTRFRTGANVSAKWLAYVLSTPKTRVLLRNIATGTSGSMKNISKAAFLALEFCMPSRKEQTAIATVLSDMDAELAALGARRDKTRALKQGMMQELLTGRTRLV